MNPLKITLTNVRSFKQAELEPPDGLLAILGANGAGKSTLISAIDVALFGPEGRTLADWYPRDGGDDPLRLMLEFEHDENIYRVTRAFSPRGRGKPTLDFEQSNLDPPFGPVEWLPLTRESIAETEAEIERIIGLSRATFRASSFLAQGDAAAFCEASPRDRKRILSEIIGLSDWDAWLDRARMAKRETQSEIDKIAGYLFATEHDPEDIERVRSSLAVAKRDAEMARATLDGLIPAIAQARELVAKVNAEKAQHQHALLRVDAAQKGLASLNQRIEERGAEIEKINAALSERKTLEQLAESSASLETEQVALQEAQQNEDLRFSLNREKGLVGESIMEVERRISASETAATLDVCDRCGQSLANQEAAHRARRSQEEERLVYERQLADLRVAHVRIHSELANMPTLAVDAERLRALATIIPKCREAAARLAGLSVMADRRIQALAELHDLNDATSSAEVEVQDATFALDAFEPTDGSDAAQADLARLLQSEADTRAALERASQTEAALTERLAHLDKIASEQQDARSRQAKHHEDLDVYTLLERACGPNGVPALILETQAIPQIEAETNRLLTELGGPAFACELRTQREKKTGGLAETLDIVLLTETGAAPYESFSGGEKARIAFALRLALAELLAARSGASTDLLIIDEIDGLDADGVAALVRVLEEMRSRIAKIIVVSHQAELRDAFEHSIRLEQVDGRSRIVEEVAA